MADLNKLIGSLSSSGAVSGFAGGLAGSALGGALTSKKGRKFAGSALKLGAVAAVGGLAYSAYRRYRQNAPAKDGSAWQNLGADGFSNLVEDRSGSQGLLIVRAMIAAGYADGHLDGDEQNRIFAEVDRIRLPASDKALLFDELKNPVNMTELVQQVSSPELAAEVYAASLVAIDETTPDGQLHLRTLASALSIPEELVSSIHEQAHLAQSEVQAA